MILLFSHCSPNSEANKEAHNKWDSILSKCDGRSFLLFAWKNYANDTEIELFEINDYKINIKAYNISEAEKLNGIEWKGKSTFESIAFRRCAFTNGKVTAKWSQWFTNMDDSFELIKSNGQWQFGSLMRSYVHQGGTYYSINCTALNELISQAQ